MLDLKAYFNRIGFKGDLTPNAGLLNALHQAHANRIPFENLDILLGRPIQVDLVSIHNKLVHLHRGGYCFEHNLLMAAVLTQLGFTVRQLAARVRLGSDQVRARTHMLGSIRHDTPITESDRTAQNSGRHLQSSIPAGNGIWPLNPAASFFDNGYGFAYGGLGSSTFRYRTAGNRSIAEAAMTMTAERSPHECRLNSRHYHAARLLGCPPKGLPDETALLSALS